MVKRYTRSEVAARLQATLEAGNAIMMAGAGNGLSAKCAEIGGIDLIVIYNSGKFRMDGLPSIAGLMPYGNANDIVLELGERTSSPPSKRRRCWRVSAAPIPRVTCGAFCSNWAKPGSPG